MPESEVESAPKVTLEVLEGPVMPIGTTYNINCRGYVGSKRQAGDGWVFVGTQECDQQGVPTNDIVLPAEELGFGAVHFVLKYDSEHRHYLIRDNGQGTGTFLKIDCPLLLRSGYAVGFGDSTMLVELEAGPSVTLRFLDGPKAEESLYFPGCVRSSFRRNDGVVKIGRMTDCEIKFTDVGLSRYQCS